MTRTNVPSSSGYVSRRVANGNSTQNPEPSQPTSNAGKPNGSKGRNDSSKNSEKRKVPINQRPTARGKEVIRLSTWRAVGQSSPAASAAKESLPVDAGGEVAVEKSPSDGKELSPEEQGAKRSSERPTLSKYEPVKPTQRDQIPDAPAGPSNPLPQQEGTCRVEGSGNVAVRKSHSDWKEPSPDEKTSERSSERQMVAKAGPVEPTQQDETHQSDSSKDEQDSLSQQHQETRPIHAHSEISPHAPSNTPAPSSPSTPTPYPSTETLWKTTQPFIPSLPGPLRRGRIPLKKSLLVQLAENPSTCPLFRGPPGPETETECQSESTQEDEDEWEGEANGYLLNPIDVMTLGQPPTELSTRLFTPYYPPVAAQEDLWLPGLGLGMPGCPAVMDSRGLDGRHVRRVVGGGCGAGGVMGEVKLEGWGKIERKEAGFEREAVKALWSVPNWEGGEWIWVALDSGVGTAWGWAWAWVWWH
ncbi:hypothetical protein KC332_g4603 [Hortaea werneckii]|nr:hypothetical protein KC358_g3195 [Hortaea werneckii]KAI6849335.1 hypothetical protein KC350_g2669 [Hortaea werneckii]KAI6926014.1 hypothetical protein KC341_g13037 [Hortaea werneckii]KAI6946001.1 hypothetical protein KC348_g3421 [Hortaea werneckii]KAI6977850.1 hypothetical protein KC321_g3223 [Hortaea werneckii]